MSVPTPDEIVASCREAGVRLVRLLYCDNGGVVRGKVVPVEHVAQRMTTGVGLTVAMQAMNSLDQLQPVDGMGPVGEIRLVPDPATFTVIPYAPRSAVMLVDQLRVDGHRTRPVRAGSSPAWSLGSASGGSSCDAPSRTSSCWLVSVEDRLVPIDSSTCFSTIGMTAAAEFVDAIVAALDAQGIPLAQYYPELGHGQHELSVLPRSALAAADTQVLVRETIRGVAAGCGLVASLAPKPWPDQAGNGAHIHFSGWDPAGTRNLFHDPAGRFGLSGLAEQFVAGILDHLRPASSP